MKKIFLWMALFLLLSPYLFADSPFYIYQQEVTLPGKELSIGLQGSRAGQELLITLYGVNQPLSFLSLQNNFHKLQIENTPWREALNYAIQNSKEDKKPEIFGKVASFASADEAPFRYILHQTYLVNEKALSQYALLSLGKQKEGLYILEVRQGNFITYALGLVSNLSLVLRRAPEKTLVYALDSTTGLPMEGAKIQFYRKSKALQEGTSGKDGIYISDLPYSPQYLILAQKGDQIAFCDPSYFPTSITNLKGYVFTERPLYLPGEKVFFKGIFRTEEKGQYFIPQTSASKVLCQVLDSRNQMVWKEEVLFQKGSCSGELEMKKGWTLGKYRILVSLEGKTFSGEFKMEEYEKPKILVAVQALKGAVVRGEKIDFQIQASYFVGGHVQKGQITYSLSKSRFDQSLFSETGLYAFYSPEEQKSFEPQVVSQGNVALDEKGKASLSFPTAKEENNYIYSLSVQVRDETRSNGSGSGQVRVAKSAFDLGFSTDKKLYKVEEDCFLTVKAIQISGEGMEVPFEAVFTRKGRVYPKGGTAGHLPRMEEVPDKILFTLKGTTDKKGSATLRTPLPEAGEMDITLNSQDSYGNAVTSSLSIWVEKGNTPVYYSGSVIQIIADKKSYAVGETAKFLVVLPVQGIAPLITVEGESILSYSTDAFSANTRVVEVKMEEKMSPNFYLHVSAIWKGGLMEQSQMVVVPPAQKILQITLKTDRKSYKPAQEAQIEVMVQDKDGKPVSTDLSLGVVDEALYALEPESRAALLPFFYSLRRPNIGGGQSLQIDSYGFAQASARLPSTPAKKNMAKKEAPSPTGRADGFGSASGGSSAAPRTMRERRASRDMPGHPESANGRTRNGDAKKKGKPSEPASKPSTRTTFATTAFWNPLVQTNGEGKASLKFTFPENLTTWRLTLKAVDEHTRIGWLESKVQTQLLVALRSSLPSFLVVGDQVKAFATVHNFQEEKDHLSLKTTLSPEVKLHSSGQIEQEVESQNSLTLPLDLEALQVGKVKVHLEGMGKKEGDAMEESFFVLPRGMEITRGISQKLRSDSVDLSSPEFTLPSDVDLKTARLLVRITPGYVAVVKQALPYLVGYPYGCVEQTMSRLIPDITAADAFQKMNIPFSQQSRLAEFVKSGLGRIYSFQNKDGGWGWWQSDGSHPHMTAYVVWGLARAKSLSYDVDLSRLQSGILKSREFSKNEKLPLPLRIYNLYAVLSATKILQNSSKEDEQTLIQLFDRKDRKALSPTSKALLGLCLIQLGQKSEAKVVVQELEASAQKIQDRDGNFLTFWGSAQERRWSRNAIEATSMVAQCLIEYDPSSPYVLSTLEWIISQKRGGIWQSTRDTALVVDACLSYILATQKKDISEGILTVKVNQTEEKVVLEKDSLEVTFAGEILQKGPNSLKIEGKNGKGIFVDAYLSFYSTSTEISAQNAGFQIQREYMVLKATSGEKGINYQAVPLSGKLKPDDIVMVKLTIETGENRDFVMVEDPLPATARVILKDGEFSFFDASAYSRPSHREFHKSKAVFFFTSLNGKVQLRYFFRPGLAGKFHAIPAKASLMYYPYVSGNSSSNLVEVE